MPESALGGATSEQCCAGIYVTEYIGVMEKNMEATIGYLGYIGIREKKMETLIVLYHDVADFPRVFFPWLLNRIDGEPQTLCIAVCHSYSPNACTPGHVTDDLLSDCPNYMQI